jgi:hypothetical protein
MAAPKSSPRTLVEAVQAVFEALEPFDEAARNRILQSASSLLGNSLNPQPSVPISAAPGASAVLAAPQPQVRSNERPLAPVELLQQKKPATNPQKLAVFAYYREKVEGLSRFSKDDLKAYFAKAKQLPPQNFDRDFRKAVSAGWIYEDGSDSYLTSKGLELVEAGFDGKGMPRGSTSKPSGTKRTKRKPKRR